MLSAILAALRDRRLPLSDQEALALLPTLVLLPTLGWLTMDLHSYAVG